VEQERKQLVYAIGGFIATTVVKSMPQKNMMAHLGLLVEI
jgi:hypothetical protein